MKSVPITSLSIEDLYAVCGDRNIPSDVVDAVYTEGDLQYIAQKMEDAYIDNLFWESLWAIIEEKVRAEINRRRRRGG